MPAFSHFFLKRFSARSKFSSSWIMTSDKIYFPPSWRISSPACVQTDKLRPRREIGQAKPPLSGLTANSCQRLPRRCGGGGPATLATLCSGGAANYAPTLRSVARLLVAKWVLAPRTSSAFPPSHSRISGSRWRLRAIVVVLLACVARAWLSAAERRRELLRRESSSRIHSALRAGAAARWTTAARAVTTLSREARGARSEPHFATRRRATERSEGA
jgi:hypothetical protein